MKATKFCAVLLLAGLATQSAWSFGESDPKVSLIWSLRCVELEKGDHLPSCRALVRLDGRIDKSSVSAFAAALSRIQAFPADGSVAIRVRLRSSGGEVESALEIGRIMRRIKAAAVVQQDDQCLSSCIFVLIGASERQVSGTVGIHRPYADSAEATLRTLTAFQKEVTQKLYAFVDEMNVQRQLVDDMMTVAPDTIRTLAPSQLYNYGIGHIDPVIEEAKSIAEAKRLGIGHSEFMARRARARAQCSPGLDPNPFLAAAQLYRSSCYLKVLLGQ
jgi:ATP-dependent protease ClpP protease subunit